MKVYNTIAKNLKTWTQNSVVADNDSVYVKYYPSQYYEYDNRGIVTINIPFNGKIIGTYKYNNNVGNTLPPEISYMSLNYQGSPVIISDATATSTQIIKRDAWGSVSTNSFDSNAVTNTEIGYTGHKYDADSDLTYAHARYLSTTNRVWLSEDPFAINNFSSDIYLNNPQIQNSYSYATEDPVNKVDPDGKKPTVMEAAYMARDIYNSKDNRGNGLIGSWSYKDEIVGGNGMLAGIYVRHGADTPNEYSLVFKGTSEMINWSDNLKQPLGNSLDALNAMYNSAISEFYNSSCSHSGDDCTAIGHSKAGPEASLMGVQYGLDVITFNPARANYHAYGLDDKVSNYKNTLDNYIVKGEMLDRVIGFMPLIGNTYVINPANTFIGPFEFRTNQFAQSVSSVNFLVSGYNSYKEHSMDSTINSLKKSGIQ